MVFKKLIDDLPFLEFFFWGTNSNDIFCFEKIKTYFFHKLLKELEVIAVVTIINIVYVFQMLFSVFSFGMLSGTPHVTYWGGLTLTSFF